jgi:PAS domain S-box-containing protein
MSAATSHGKETFTVHRAMRFIGLRGSLAADRTARMLHILLAILVVWFAVAWVATAPFAPVSFPRIVYPAILVASYFTALVLLRLGHFRRAGLAYLIGTWIWATLVCYSYGGIHSAGALLYVSLPVSAAWLLGSSAAIWTAGECLLSALVFTVLEMTHVSLSLQAKATPLGTWAVIVQAVLINAVPVGQIIGRLRETALARQRTTEELQTAYSELRRQKDMFQTIFDQIPMMINFGDGEFGLRLVNRTWEQTLGWTLDEIRRDNVDILVENYPDPEYRESVRDFVLASNGEWGDFKTTVRDGRIIDTSWMMFHLPDGTSMGIGQDITERKRAAEDLAASRDEIRAHAARLVTAQEDERRRLSIEVHDQICQDLASIAIELGGYAAKPPRREDVAARFRALQARVVKAAHEAGHIAYQLHPSVLDHLGLPSALQDLCNQFAKRAPAIALEFTSGTLPPSVPREVAACLYRIAQESLQNAARHSSAKNGSIALAWQAGTMVLMITDDGVGFDPQAARENGGLGIIGMEERARSVNGKLTIAAEPGSGTRIVLEVPLPAPG